MNLGKVLEEIQDDLLSGDFDAETKYATHFLKIESLKMIPMKELKVSTEDNKEITDVYNKLAELSDTSELPEMINALSDRLAFYMALSQKLEVRYMASQIIINKLVSGELKPGVQTTNTRFKVLPKKGTGRYEKNIWDNEHQCLRSIWDIWEEDILRDFLK